MKIHRVLIAALTALATCSLAPAAGYIKFDGIDGESKAKGHEKWIELSSVTGLEAAQAAAVKAPRDAATGQASGRRQHQALVITKQLDKSSPKLAEAVAKKQVFPTLSVSDGTKSYVLRDAIISSIQKTAGGESVTLNFTKIEFKNERPTTASQAPRPVGPAEKAKSN